MLYSNIYNKIHTIIDIDDGRQGLLNSAWASRFCTNSELDCYCTLLCRARPHGLPWPSERPGERLRTPPARFRTPVRASLTGEGV